MGQSVTFTIGTRTSGNRIVGHHNTIFVKKVLIGRGKCSIPQVSAARVEVNVESFHTIFVIGWFEPALAVLIGKCGIVLHIVGLNQIKDKVHGEKGLVEFIHTGIDLSLCQATLIVGVV